MLFVAGSIFNASDLIHEFSEQSVQGKLLYTMSGSRISYRYDNVHQLKFELSLRNAIVDASVALQRSGLRFAKFINSFCNQTYWRRTPEGGFLLKENAAPSDAIFDIYHNGNKYGIECSTAIMILYYGALLDIYGKDLFNRTFPRIYLMNWKIQEPLLMEAGKSIKGQEALYGDRQYFANPDVSSRNPEWQGENVIVLPNSLYYGHGTGIRSAGEIMQKLNSTRRWGARQSAYLMDVVARPDFKKLGEVYLGMVTFG